MSTEDPRSELTRWRDRIEEIDHKLIVLLAERMSIGLKTAEIKRAAGLPILDPQREAEVIRRAGEAAREHHLPEEEVRGIFWHIVGLSRRAQEDEK
jgi:chorismate mutase